MPQGRSTNRLLNLIEAGIKVIQARVLDKTERQLRELERMMAREVGDVFKLQGSLFLEEFEKIELFFIATEIFTEEVGRDVDTIFYNVNLRTHDQLKDILIKYGLLSSSIAEETFTGSVGVEAKFDLYDPAVYDYLQKHAAERVTGINEETRLRIREIISDGYRDRKTYSEIARDIKNEFEQFAEPRPQAHIRNRAELVAVTELREAHEFSQFKMAKEFMDQGFAMQKRLVVTRDEKLCRTCREDGEVGWIDANEYFPSGAFLAPIHPGCRCRVVYRINPETWKKSMTAKAAVAGGES